MQLYIQQLPSSRDDHVILRHYLVYPDGRIFFQEENVNAGSRSDWELLPTPPVVPPVIGIIDYGGMPLAMRADGSSWIYGQEVGKMGQSWAPFLTPVPE